MSTVVSERPRPSYNATDLVVTQVDFPVLLGAMTLGWLVCCLSWYVGVDIAESVSGWRWLRWALVRW